MSGSNVYIPRFNGETRSDYSPEYDASLFSEGKGKAVLRSIKERLATLLRRRNETELPLNRMLEDLVQVAESQPEWPRWRYGDHDRTRVFTPPFALEMIKGANVLSRLHIALDDFVSSQAIVHIEKAVFDKGEIHMFSGQEIIWRRHSSDTPMMSIVSDGRNIDVGPETNSEFWNSATRMITAAHAELVEPSVGLEF